MPQDIVITPNRGSTTSGAQIAFTGYSGATSIYLKVLPDSSLSFEGSAGQLFSITDNLSSGTIFSVNDITGIPSFDVNANGLVRLAPYAGNVGLGTTATSGRLQINTGSASTIGQIIQVASGQSANAFEIRNTSGDVISYLSPDGTFNGNIGVISGTTNYFAKFNSSGAIVDSVAFDNGSIMAVRQPGGTAGTDEIQLSHDGTKGTIRSIDGDLQLGGSNSSVNIRNSANNGNGNLSCNWLYTNGFGAANIINSEGRTVDSYSWTIDSQTFNWNQNFHIRVGWAHIRGFGHAGGIRYAGNNTIGQYASLQITNGFSSPTGGCLSYMSSTTTISSTANDFRPTYYSAFQRLNPTNNYDITGINSYPTIVNSGGGICGWSHADGKVMWLHNVSTNYSLTLKHQTGSLSENQFYCDTGADIVLGPNKMLQLTYDGTISKWRVNTTSMPYNLPASDGPNGSVLQTNGSGTISWTTSPIASGGLQNYMVASGAIYGNALASGAVSTYNLNATNLASGKFLALNGSQLSWQAISTVTGSGAINISNDTTTNDVRYPLFTNATTGTLATGYVSSTKLSFNPSTGDLTVGGNVTANSDERIKANISTIESAVEKVNQLRGVYFERKDSGIKNIGVIAQEVEKVIPEVVRESDGIKSVAYGNIVALLIEAIKEQDKKIKLLEEKLCQ